MSLSLRTPILASFLVVLTACSPLDLAGSLLGGGPNVNGQIGQTNQQGINVTTAAPSVSLRPQSRVDTIDQSSSGNRVENAGVVNNLDGVPLSWFIITLLVGIIGWMVETTPQNLLSKLWKRK